MRCIARTKNDPDIKRIMLDGKDETGTHVFYFTSEEEGSGIGDGWYETFEIAMSVVEEEFGILKSDWTYIEEVREYCQQDWVTPARIKGREIGKPKFNEPNNIELFIDGEWISIEKVKEIPKIIYKEDLE